jgi:ribosomal protein S18
MEKKKNIDEINEPIDSDKIEKVEETEKPTNEKSYSHSSKSRFTPKKNVFFKKRVCFFCRNEQAKIDYKDVGLLRRFVAESGKISPRRFTGTCAKHQKKLAVEIKKARQMALLHFTDKHK